MVVEALVRASKKVNVPVAVGSPVRRENVMYQAPVENEVVAVTLLVISIMVLAGEPTTGKSPEKNSMVLVPTYIPYTVSFKEPMVFCRTSVRLSVTSDTNPVYI